MISTLVEDYLLKNNKDWVLSGTKAFRQIDGLMRNISQSKDFMYVWVLGFESEAAEWIIEVCNF